MTVELSDGGRGNHWGRTCDDSDGFRESNEPDATGLVDSTAPDVHDRHPYGFPVAGIVDDALLGQTCPQP